MADESEIYVDSVDDREWGLAWKEYSAKNGSIQNIPTSSHLRKFLASLKINLTEKSCDTLMLICKDKGQVPFVHLTTLKSVIKEALQTFQGLPVDQAIGGVIVEFKASDIGRKHRNQQSMQSMQAIVTASTQSLSHYALSKIKETKQDKQRRKEQEKLKRQLKREKLYKKQHGVKDKKDKKKDKKDKKEKTKESSPPTQGPFTHTTTTKRYTHYLQNSQNSQEDDQQSDSPSRSSVVINATPKTDNNNNNDYDSFPNTENKKKQQQQINVRRFGSSDIALQRKQSRDRDKTINDNNNNNNNNNNNDDNKDDDNNNIDIIDNRNNPNYDPSQQVIEILRGQENMLYRIQTQMDALNEQIKSIEADSNNNDEDTNSALKECILELEYLKTSTMADISNELNNLKIELFDGFESISISSAYNVSQDIKKELNSMNNVIDRTVRLWGNDWNVKKRVISNQQKLDHVLFKASKILRKYQEMQSNLKSMKFAHNNNIKMNVPQFISEMDTIRTSLKSMDHYLSTFVFDRLSRMENALIRIFKKGENGSIPFNQNSSETVGDNRSIKRFSVDELMNQLDSQRLNFEGQLRRKSEKINNLKEELFLMKQTMDREKEKINDKIDQFSNLRGKYEMEQANNKQLQFDLKNMKSQLQRLSMFNNKFGAISNNTATRIQSQSLNNNKKPDLNRMSTVAIHPDIGSNDGGNEVDLSLEFDTFYSNSLSSLIGDFISKSKLENKSKANEYHKNKERGHLIFRKDEVPKFLANRNNRDAQQIELEERLGFGYEELYYLYRENTEINITCNRLQHENDALRARLKSIEPVIIIENVQNVGVSVQNQLTKLYKLLRETEMKYKDIRDKKQESDDEMRFIDKYRIEMLQDAKKVEQEVQSQMNYDKFQFQRQRKKMNALMKSEKEGVLKEREIMEQERQQIETLKIEWKQKLDELNKKEAEFEEKVVLAKTNMNEVVFQKGLSEHLKDHIIDLKIELREEVEKEAIKDATDEIREEYEEQITKQREYYNKRYSIANSKHDQAIKECETLKLQIVHFKKQIEKLQKEVIIAYDEQLEQLSGEYDTLERQYQILKEEYQKLEKTKNTVKEITKDADDDESKSNNKSNKKYKKKNGGQLGWLEEDSDDDDITKCEKKSIKTWLKQRHGDFDKSPKHNNHWLILPKDKLAGKDQDIEDLNNTIKALKQELDVKSRENGQYKQQIENYKKQIETGNNEIGGSDLIKKLDKKHINIIKKFDSDIENVKKWMKVWEDGIKNVTKAQHKWTLKNSELVKKEKEIQKEKEDLIYDQRMWYAHKNHILRRFYYFTKQVWWQRFIVHEFQKSRADQEMAMFNNLSSSSSKTKDKSMWGPKPNHHLECPLWNQYYKMMLESWFETGVYQHALTRWFCQYNTYTKEKDLFYYSDNDNNEELYVFKQDVINKIQPHLDSIVERYYKQKWMKRRLKFGRCFIAAEKPTIIVDKSYNGFQKLVRDLFRSLYEKEPSYHQLPDINRVISRAEKEMEEKIKGFTRQQWDAVKMTDGVGVVPIAEQRKSFKGGYGKRDSNTPRSSRRKSIKKNSNNAALPAIKTDSADNQIVDMVSTPGGSKKKKKVRIAGATQKLAAINDGDDNANKNNKDDIDDGKDDYKDGIEQIRDLKTDINTATIKKKEKKEAKRASMRTPKASSQKTWSHAMSEFKSVNKREKKKLSAEEKKKLRQKRKQQRHSQQKSSSGHDGAHSSSKRMEKRSSVKNPISNLGSSAIKMIKPDTQTQND